MWDFLSQVLERGGFVALLFVIVIGVFMLAVRTLWKKNETLVADLQAMHREINGLQERRVDDAKAITAQVVSHVAKIDNTMDKVERSLDVVIQRR